MRPKSLAEVARRAADGEWRSHLDEFLDAFYAAGGDVACQSAMLADRPDPIGDDRADAFLGGVGEHLARRWGGRIPAWSAERGRFLATAMFCPDSRDLRGYLMAVSPVAFRTRLIFTGPDPLRRARFPDRRDGQDFLPFKPLDRVAARFTLR